MTQADLGQGVATSGAPSCSADVNQVGLHAERLMNLYPSTPATVTRDEGLMLYRDMTLGRRFEDKCAEMYYRGKMFGFVHLYNGQEAVSTGVIKAMKMQHEIRAPVAGVVINCDVSAGQQIRAGERLLSVESAE